MWKQRMEREIIFNEAKLPFLSIYDMSATAPCPDIGFRGNGDCRHTCLPGPRDTWTEMIYNFVMFSPLMDILLKTKSES